MGPPLEQAEPYILSTQEKPTRHAFIDSHALHGTHSPDTHFSTHMLHTGETQRHVFLHSYALPGIDSPNTHFSTHMLHTGETHPTHISRLTCSTQEKLIRHTFLHSHAPHRRNSSDTHFSTHMLHTGETHPTHISRLTCSTQEKLTRHTFLDSHAPHRRDSPDTRFSTHMLLLLWRILIGRGLPNCLTELPSLKCLSSSLHSRDSHPFANVLRPSPSGSPSASPTLTCALQE